MTDICRINPKYTKAAISNRAVNSGITGLRKAYFVEKKTSGKHNFQNDLLRFDLHKIVAGIEQKKIVKAGQLLVTDVWHIRAITKSSVFISLG